MSTKLISRNITQLIKASYQTTAPRLLSPFRTYALSRFPDRNSGNSRQREKPKRVTPRAPPPQDEPAEQGSGWFNFPSNVEGKPSAEESPLWQASQRPPASDPEEGLTRLLMDNNLLIVTRSARVLSAWQIARYLSNVRPESRQIEMLNIFVGFEQANKYIICTCPLNACSIHSECSTHEGTRTHSERTGRGPRIYCRRRKELALHVLPTSLPHAQTVPGTRHGQCWLPYSMGPSSSPSSPLA